MPQSHAPQLTWSKSSLACVKSFENSRQLVIVEDLDPKTEAAEVTKRLGMSGESTKAFQDYHSEEWARWTKPKAPTQQRRKNAEQLPPSYQTFLDTYGTLTLLAAKDTFDAARYVGNVSDMAWVSSRSSMRNGVRR